MASDLEQAGYKLTAADWFRAARANDVEALKKFVAAGFDLKTQDSEKNVALHYAAMGGAEKAAGFFLDRGIAVDERNASQATPLMLAVIEKQPAMVNYLLRQGAAPQAKDQDGYTPLMLAVREGSANCVSELAVYGRDELDAALLLAAMEGKPEIIDALTNYGASVYARMEDGRTPLMIAAENGQMDAVKLLTDLGSSRFTMDSEGRTAAALASAAGFPEIAAYLSKEPAADELSLETDRQVAAHMEEYVDSTGDKPDLASEGKPSAAPAATTPVAATPGSTATSISRPKAMPLQGAILSRTISRVPPRPGNVKPVAVSPSASPGAVPVSPPIVMRNYREREVPVEIRTVEGDSAVVRIQGSKPREMKVKEGQPIPGSNLVIVKVRRRMENSKLNLGKSTEVSVVEVKDTSSGATREWIAGVPSRAHDPVALVEDSATGRRYVASPGQRFKTEDEMEFIVSDVRPNQIVIENAADGEVQTILLSGPRG